MAIQHVKETGEEAYYVEMDLKNLSGLNAALGHSGANEIFSMIAAIVRREFSAIASEACFFRHGGDEMSAFLIDTTESDLRRAIIKANREIALLADSHDLNAIPHPKHEGDERFSGLGIYFGFAEIQACHEAEPEEVFSMADRVVENKKMRAVG
jgi:GGDEF domain-containing protein